MPLTPINTNIPPTSYSPVEGPVRRRSTQPPVYQTRENTPRTPTPSPTSSSPRLSTWKWQSNPEPASSSDTPDLTPTSTGGSEPSPATPEHALYHNPWTGHKPGQEPSVDHRGVLETVAESALDPHWQSPLLPPFDRKGVSAEAEEAGLDSDDLNPLQDQLLNTAHRTRTSADPQKAREHTQGLIDLIERAEGRIDKNSKLGQKLQQVKEGLTGQLDMLGARADQNMEFNWMKSFIETLQTAAKDCSQASKL